MKMTSSILALLCSCLIAGSCSKDDTTIPDWPWTDPQPDPEPEFVEPNPEITAQGWVNVKDEFGILPEAVSVYKSPSTLKGASAIAYIAVATESFNVWGINDASLTGSTDALKTPADVYTEKQPSIVINGGYFYSDGGKNYAASLAINNGTLLSPNINYASRDWETIYYPTRAVFLEHNDGSFEAGWTYYSNADNHFLYQAPAPNSWDSTPCDVPSATYPSTGTSLNAKNGIGGGPVLIKGGVIKNTGAEELFEANSDVAYAGVGPRTAIGVTSDKKLILFVCEGRNMTEGVAGFSTETVASIMKDLGCTEAINLDGGGSTCMLVNGKETIKPSDGTQRKVGSCVYLK